METQLFVEAHRRARALGVHNVLVATNTGESVEMAQEAMGPDFHFYAVGNPAGSRAEGLVVFRHASPRLISFATPRRDAPRPTCR